MRDDRERLLDMLEAIQKIEQYADDETFSSQNANRENPGSIMSLLVMYLNCPIKNPLSWRVSLSYEGEIC